MQCSVFWLQQLSLSFKKQQQQQEKQVCLTGQDVLRLGQKKMRKINGDSLLCEFLLKHKVLTLILQHVSRTFVSHTLFTKDI